MNATTSKQSLVVVIPRFCLSQNTLHLRRGVPEVGRDLVELIHNLTQKREGDNTAGAGASPITLDILAELLVPLVGSLDNGLEFILGIQNPPTLLVLFKVHTSSDRIASLEVIAKIIDLASIFGPLLCLDCPVPSIGLDLKQLKLNDIDGNSGPVRCEVK